MLSKSVFFPRPWFKSGSIYRSRTSGRTRGFTIVEVMVSMILVTTFLMVTMQVFLSAAFLRAKAVEYNEAHNWIQEDFEAVLTKAKSFEMHTPHSSYCDAVDPANGFAAGFMDTEQGLGGASVNLGQKSFGGQTFSLTRSADYAGTLEPYRLLDLKYDLVAVEKNKTVLELDTKVVVYAAFNCPQSEE